MAAASHLAAAARKRAASVVEDGTTITSAEDSIMTVVCSRLSPLAVAELSAAGVRSLRELAAMTDDALQHVCRILIARDHGASFGAGHSDALILPSARATAAVHVRSIDEDASAAAAAEAVALEAAEAEKRAAAKRARESNPLMAGSQRQAAMRERWSEEVLLKALVDTLFSGRADNQEHYRVRFRPLRVSAKSACTRLFSRFVLTAVLSSLPSRYASKTESFLSATTVFRARAMASLLAQCGLDSSTASPASTSLKPVCSRKCAAPSARRGFRVIGANRSRKSPTTAPLTRCLPLVTNEQASHAGLTALRLSCRAPRVRKLS